MIDLFTPIRDRKSRWGVRPAADYINGFAGCLSKDGTCPASLLGVGGGDWEKCLKDAATRATYSNDRMLIKKSMDAADSDPAGAILAFENILTAGTKDRDGDILDSAGAVLDMKMPLLWQHLSIHPIGRIVAEVSRGKSFVKTRFAIADTELGRDTAVLVKFGALRISHGFEPIEYEPLFDSKDRQTGWHIKKFNVYEGSVVSIPAHPSAEILEVFEKSKSWAGELDGIRTSYGRGLLKSAAVSTWAKAVYDARPVQVSVKSAIAANDVSPSRVSKSYDGIDFMPSETVVNAYKNGLKRHEDGETGDGIQKSTIAQARRFAAGKACSPSWARKGNRWWGRNARFAEADPGTPAYAAAQLWGGSNWFAKIVDAMDREDEKSIEAESKGLSVPTKKSCECQSGKKNLSVPSTKMYGEYHFAGSFEHIQASLSKSVKRYMMSADSSIGEYTWCFVMATFSDHALVCVESRNYEYDCFKVSYSVSGDSVEWTGRPERVEVKVSAEVMSAAKSREFASADEFVKAFSGVKSGKARDQMCKCPECGYEDKMPAFMPAEKGDDMDADDEKTLSRLEGKLFSMLIANPSRMLKFRDGLSAVLDARDVPKELGADEVLFELAGLR